MLRTEFPPNRRVSHYTVIKRIGRGGFGDVYLVQDCRNMQIYAMKTEALESPKQAIKHEVEFLTDLHIAYFPAVRGFGEEADCRFFCMDVLGPSISAVRRRLQDKRFTRAVGLAIAEETLKIIQSLHGLGIVHRDIKPSNFLLRPRSNAPLCLIDFGLARRYIDPATKRPFPVSCVSKRFTGTVKYASPNAHRGMDLGPRDDLFSWFYSLVEIIGNALPWEDIKEQEQCGIAKQAIGVDELCANMPQKFDVMYRSIAAFTYEAPCDYRRIFSLLNEARAAEQIHPDGTELGLLMNIIPEAMEIVPDVTEQLNTGQTIRTPLIGDPERDSPHICPGCHVI